MTIKRWVFFIDHIEDSSYPVTETGYAMLYRAWRRARASGGKVYVVYPETSLAWDAGTPIVSAHPVLGFSSVPYRHYRSQQDRYDASADVGSSPCHAEGAAIPFRLSEADVVVFRQESGPRRTALLVALGEVESRVPIYLSPRLALSKDFGSKVLPARIAPDRVPHSWTTTSTPGSTSAKVAGALAFFHRVLGDPDTAIVKPAHGDNGIGITTLGRSPLTGEADQDPALVLSEMIDIYEDVIVQEYLPSVRAPEKLTLHAGADLPPERRDFGELRFILIDGQVPRDALGRPIRFARRVPTGESLLADSGISHPTTLSEEELSFLEEVGEAYRRWGIHFGGGDLIRTPDPARPFVFTDAAQSVCGHAVVTGALNGDAYLIVDKVLDSIESRVEAFEPKPSFAPRSPEVRGHTESAPL